MNDAKQKKHDVNQRNDDNPRTAFRNGRGDFHRANFSGWWPGPGRRRFVQMDGVTRFSTAADHHFDVRRRRFQIELQLRHLGGEKVEGNQREDGDAESAGRGNQRLADAAGDAGDGQFRAADVEKRAHQAGHGAEQTQQRRERDERVHDGQKTPGAFEFDARRQLQRAQQRGVGVADMARP